MLKKKDIVLFVFLFCIAMVSMAIGMAIVGNLPQQYTEYVVETDAANGSNKLGELHLFWSILWIGVACIVAYHILGMHGYLSSRENARTERSVFIDRLFSHKELAVALIASLVSIIFLGKIPTPLVFADALLLTAAFFSDDETERDVQTLGIISYFAMIGAGYPIEKALGTEFGTEVWGGLPSSPLCLRRSCCRIIWEN